MKKIRWGIAGPGKIANKFAKAIKNVECAELAAVASRSLEKGKAFAEQYDVPHVFGSYEEMAQSDKVDAVYVATPHPFHKSCAEIFLNSKKHVLCEKPLCVNEAQTRQLCECAEKNGVFLMEAMWTKLLPAIKEAVRLVESGAIGEVRGLRADFCYDLSPSSKSKVYENSMAGGSLLDVGVYGLHFASLFLGYEPVEIKATSYIDYNVDCHTQIALKYKNGAIADISSAVNVYKPEDAYIYGSAGYIRLPHFYGAKELFVCTDGTETHISKPCMTDGFEEEIVEACLCINEGKLESDAVPHKDTIAIVRQMDAVRGIIGLKYPFDEM